MELIHQELLEKQVAHLEVALSSQELEMVLMEVGLSNAQVQEKQQLQLWVEWS